MRRAATLGTMALALAAVACHSHPGTPLAAAAAAGDLAAVEALLAEGVRPDEMDPRGLTALHWAARYDRADVVGALLEGGASVDLPDRAGNGWTPLMHAVHMGADRAARALVEAGADVNARSRAATPLIMAAAYGNSVIVRFLLGRGADPAAEARKGVTALWAAAGGGSLVDLTDGPPLGTCFPETVQALLEKAPDLRLKDNLKTRLLALVVRSEECARLVKSLREG